MPCGVCECTTIRVTACMASVETFNQLWSGGLGFGLDKIHPPPDFIFEFMKEHVEQYAYLECDLPVEIAFNALQA